MNVIERSIEFVTQWEPDFAAGLQGAAAAEILAIEDRMGRPCSAVYRAFLERMGERTGSVDFGQYSTRPAELLAEREAALESLPPGVELLAIPTGDHENDVFLVHDPAVPDDARLVRHPSLELEETGDFDPARTDAVAGGFGELLCLPALNRHHVRAQRHTIALSDPQQRADTLARCRDIVDAFGLAPYWFSNAWTYIGHADELVVVAKQAPKWFFSLGVAGPERWAWAAVAGTLRWRLGLTSFR